MALNNSPDKLHPLSPTGFYELLFNPALYFSPGKTLNSKLLQIIVILPFSMMIVKGNLIKKWITRYELRHTEAVLPLYTDWTLTWAVIIGAGLIGVIFIYWVGIKWYLLRLRWSGAKDPQYEDAKFVFFFSSLVYTIPGLMLLLHQTEVFPHFLAVLKDTGPEYFFISLTFLLWSVSTQWIGVKSRFRIKGPKAMWWFIFMPLMAQLYHLHQQQILYFLREFLLRNLP